jgi:hypothetical protein
VSFAGAILALWLIREREIERMPLEPAEPPDPESAATDEADTGESLSVVRSRKQGAAAS